jgi:hypothetical protein
MRLIWWRNAQTQLEVRTVTYSTGTVTERTPIYDCTGCPSMLPPSSYDKTCYPITYATTETGRRERSARRLCEIVRTAFGNDAFSHYGSLSAFPFLSHDGQERISGVK